MGCLWRVRFGLLLVASAIGEIADAGVVRIHHAEPVTLSAASLPAPGKLSKAGRARVSFSALGRRFDLELESNEDLLAPLPAERRRGVIERVQPYRGVLSGKPGSWVRLSRDGTELQGLIWDGREFLSIAPGRAVGAFIDAVDDSMTSGNVIYRVADMDIDLGPGFCKAVRRPVNADRVNGEAAFEALVDELRSNKALAAVVTREIEVSLLGDYEFWQTQGTAESALVARFNIVDGIFSSQLDLRITVGRMDVFTTPDDPFTGSDPEKLLERVGGYREGHGVLQAFGLTHLVTGRALDGDVVGMGFIGGVCDAYAGASLSSDMGFDVTTSALVAAHELGHNFGAEHDNEPGSACASTPDGYLMNPSVNGSSQFSQCSLDTMEPVIANAPCVFPAKYTDVRVVAAGDTLHGVVGTPLEYSVDVESVGTDVAPDVTIHLDFSGWFTVEDAIAQGGSCTISAGSDSATCNLGTLAATESRRVTLHVTGRFAGTAYFYARADAAGDDIPANDLLRTTVIMDPRADVTVSAVASEESAYTGETITTAFYIDASGTDPATDVGFTLDLYSVNVLSAHADAGDCTISGPRVFCAFGTMQPQTRRQVLVSYTGTYQTQTMLSPTVSASNDDNPNNNSVAVPVTINASRDLSTTTSVEYIDAVVGESVHLSFVVSSVGPESVSGASYRVHTESGLAVTGIVAGDSPCGLDGEGVDWRCDLGTLAGGETRTIDVTVTASASGSMQLTGYAQSDADENRGNEYAYAYVRARFASDLAVLVYSTSGFDDRPFDLRVDVESLGASASTGASVTLRLPAGWSVQSASAEQGTCTTGTATISCSLGTIEPGHTVMVSARVASESIGQFQFTADTSADADQNPSNDHRFGWASVSAATDAILELPAPITGRVDQALEATFGVRASKHDLTNVRIEIYLTGSLTVESVTSSDGRCEVSGSWQASCTIDTLPAGSRADFTAHLRGTAPGTGWISAQVHYGSDIDYTNNDGNVEYTVDAEPPDPGGGGGGGGGGGRLDALWLLIGLGLLAMRSGVCACGRCRAPSARTPVRLRAPMPAHRRALRAAA